MTRPSKLTHPSDIPHLAPGFPVEAITRTTSYKSPVQFEKQRMSVARRQSNASVVGIILLDQDRIALVQRHKNGSNPGWAAASGSLRPRSLWRSDETFVHGLKREVRQELGIRLAPESVTLQELEERTFIQEDTGESQWVYVATYLGHAAIGENIRQTRAANREGLIVGAFALNNIPALAFNDNAKVAQVLSQLAA